MFISPHYLIFNNSTSETFSLSNSFFPLHTPSILSFLKNHSLISLLSQQQPKPTKCFLRVCSEPSTCFFPHSLYFLALETLSMLKFPAVILKAFLDFLSSWLKVLFSSPSPICLFHLVLHFHLFAQLTSNLTACHVFTSYDLAPSHLSPQASFPFLL